jgi:hypothetical protein
VIDAILDIWPGCVVYFEIFRQPILSSGSIFLALNTIFINQILRLKWLNYIEKSVLKKVICALMIPFYLVHAVLKYFLSKKVKNFYLIERYVTNKHIGAWVKFVKNNSDYLIVLEDDVLLKVGTQKQIHGFLSFLQRQSQGPLYIDIAGGLSVESLGISRLIKSNLNGQLNFYKPVTNTAAGYVLNAELAKHFLGELKKTPKYKKLPIDWLMNSIFMKSKPGQIECIHYNPSIFIHGSNLGYVESWQSIVHK